MGDENGLVWSILDCEESEWEKAISAAGSPVAHGQSPATAGRGAVEPAHAGIQRSRIYRFLTCTLLLVALCGLIGLRLWQDAERGVALIKQDIANVVTLETVKASTQQGSGPASGNEATQVQAVDFRGDEAMVHVVVTRTAACGTVVVVQQLRFYTRDNHGWQRSSPAAVFWGDTRELDTPRLHFVYRALDSAVVTAVAQDADALQAQIDALLGVTRLAASTVITIEIMPYFVTQVGNGRSNIQLTSPQLMYYGLDQTNVETLALVLRTTLVNRAVAQSQSQRLAQPQWTPMINGLHLWLLVSESLPLAQGRLAIDKPTTAQHIAESVPRLPWCARCPEWAETYYGQPSDLAYWSEAATHFVDYVAMRYGPARVARLYAGMGIYEDWNELAPAVFGMSAEELEADWLASIDKSADNSLEHLSLEHRYQP